MKKYWIMLVGALSLLGCQSGGVFSPGGDSTQGPEEAAVSAGINGVYSGGGGIEGSYNPGAASGYDTATGGDFYNDPDYGKGVVGGPRAVARDRVVYFAYDSDIIDTRAQSIIQAHAAYLVKHPRIKLLLEGHTDSRGSREYNIALGERRAISVLKQFQNLGVPISQVRIISYGEEKPAVSGYSESAYQRNRRVVIQY